MRLVPAVPDARPDNTAVMVSTAVFREAASA